MNRKFESLPDRREEFTDDLSTNLVEQGRVDADIESVRTRIKELERQIEQAKKSDKRARLLSRKVELAQKAADKIDEVHGTFAMNKRLEIEQETRRIFHSLAWKGDHFQDVRLTRGLPTRSNRPLRVTCTPRTFGW